MPTDGLAAGRPDADETLRRPAYDLTEQIKDLILAREIRPGAPLPPETELMAALGVSRSSLREAIKGLQARGIVSVEHGRGTFVGRPTLDPMVDALIFHRHVAARTDRLDTAADLIDIRDILETRLVQRVANVVDEEQLAALDATVGRMEDSARAGIPFQVHDRQFHEQLYAPLGNHLVIQLVAAFWDVLDAVHPLLPPSTSDMVADVALHRRILDRLRERDPDGAAVAMHEHFRDAHSRFDDTLAADAALSKPGPAAAPR